MSACLICHKPAKGELCRECYLDRRLKHPPMSAEDARKQCERVKAGSKMGPSCAAKLATPEQCGL